MDSGRCADTGGQQSQGGDSVPAAAAAVAAAPAAGAAATNAAASVAVTAAGAGVVPAAGETVLWQALAALEAYNHSKCRGGGCAVCIGQIASRHGISADLLKAQWRRGISPLVLAVDALVACSHTKCRGKGCAICISRIAAQFGVSEDELDEANQARRQAARLARQAAAQQGLQQDQQQQGHQEAVQARPTRQQQQQVQTWPEQHSSREHAQLLQRKDAAAVQQQGQAQDRAARPKAVPLGTAPVAATKQTAGGNQARGIAKFVFPQLRAENHAVQRALVALQAYRHAECQGQGCVNCISYIAAKYGSEDQLTEAQLVARAAAVAALLVLPKEHQQQQVQARPRRQSIALPAAAAVTVQKLQAASIKDSTSGRAQQQFQCAAQSAHQSKPLEQLQAAQGLVTVKQEKDCPTASMAAAQQAQLSGESAQPQPQQAQGAGQPAQRLLGVKQEADGLAVSAGVQQAHAHASTKPAQPPHLQLAQLPVQHGPEARRLVRSGLQAQKLPGVPNQQQMVYFDLADMPFSPAELRALHKARLEPYLAERLSAAVNRSGRCREQLVQVAVKQCRVEMHYPQLAPAILQLRDAVPGLLQQHQKKGVKAAAMKDSEAAKQLLLVLRCLQEWEKQRSAQPQVPLLLQLLLGVKADAVQAEVVEVVNLLSDEEDEQVEQQMLAGGADMVLTKDAGQGGDCRVCWAGGIW